MDIHEQPANIKIVDIKDIKIVAEPYIYINYIYINL
jgi:hypothetical protein